jgi:hypothetical protein
VSDASATLDIVTVVYSGELDQLRLQARSMARFLSPAGIGRIVVIVNDADEDGCAARLMAVLPDYGPLASRVEVVRPDALFAARPAVNRPRGPRQRLKHWFTRNRRRYPLGFKGGWRGNRGWSMQQALKLAAARHGDSAFVVLLDAKNHFVRPVGLASFVSPDGRAKSLLDQPGEKRWTWIEGSFRLFGLPPPGRWDPAPPTTTPVCVPRAVLLGCLDAVERRVGPVESFFARKRGEQSEFMLLYAYVAGRHGDWNAVFAPGLEPAATIHRRSGAAEVDRVLGLAETGRAEILSVHSSRLAGLTPQERGRLAAIWADRKLPADELLARMGPAD